MINEQTKSIYIEVLLRELNRLQSELPHARDMANHSKSMYEYYTQKELMINSQIDQVKQEIEKAKNNEFSMIPEKESKITKIDSKLTKVDEEADGLFNEIQELKRQANASEDSLEKTRLLAQAKSKTIKLRELQSKRIKFGNRQRSVLLKKNKKAALKRKMIAKQEAIVARNEIKARELDEKQMNLDPDKFLNALVVDKVLDVRRKSNEWKASFDRQVLENLKNSKLVGIKGARAIAVAKTAGQRLRERVKPVLSAMADMIRPEENSSEPRVVNRK